jgi:predicted GNAT superfamily acetyltransferase
LSIPADLAAAKAAGAAETWQQHVRVAFQSAFDAGFVAVGFQRGEQPGYLLERLA